MLIKLVLYIATLPLFFLFFHSYPSLCKNIFHSSCVVILHLTDYVNFFNIYFADYVSGGELFTHLYQRERFAENEVRIYIAEIILALEHLHKVILIFMYLKKKLCLLRSALLSEIRYKKKSGEENVIDGTRKEWNWGPMRCVRILAL